MRIWVVTIKIGWQGPDCGQRHLPHSMLTAIQIGADPVLLRTRGAVLESFGLRVISVESASEAMEAIWASPFDLAILCHSLSRSDRRSVTAAIRRRNPSARVLLVSGGLGANMAEKDGMDAVLEPNPHKLVQGLRQILRSPNVDAVENRSQEASQA